MAGLVRMVNHPFRLPLLQGHVQGLEHEFGPQVGAHRPPHDPAAPDIEHHGQVEKSRPGGNVGDIGHPELVGPRGSELPVHEIPGRCILPTPPRRPDASAPADPLQTGRSHDAGNPVQAGVDPTVGKFGMHARGAVRPVALLVDQFHGPEKSLVRLVPR